MCRYIIHTEVELPIEFQEKIEFYLYHRALDILGSLDGDVEFFWPVERLGRGAPTISVDAQFTVGEEEGDISPDRQVFSIFANSVLTFLEVHQLLNSINPGDPVAVWIQPDEGKSIYLSATRY